MNSTPIISLLSLLAFSAIGHSASYQLGATFASDTPTLNPNYGSAILSYEAEQPLLDGSYAWTSFSNLQLVVNMGSSVFTEDDLLSTPSKVYIEVRNGGFYFSNENGPSEGSGAAAFATGEYRFSVQPVSIGSNSSVRFAYNKDGEGAFFVGGTYAPAAVPEPSVPLLSALALAGFAVRRRRAR